MFRQHAAHDVLVDVDPEGPRDDTRDSWTAEARIARLEFDDSLNERLVLLITSTYVLTVISDWPF
jgi:hypothetical protein